MKPTGVSLLLGLFLISFPSPATEDLPGVVVDAVEPTGAAAAAGLAPGDLLLSWERPPAPPANPDPARGTLLLPFDLEAVELEQAPRGPVTLLVDRDGEFLWITLSPVPWRFSVRPGRPALLVEMYRKGQARLASGKVESAVHRLQLVAATAEQAGELEATVWFLLRLGEVLNAAREVPAAEAAYDQALVNARAAASPRLQAQVWETRGTARLRRGALAEAEAAYQAALTLREARFPDTLGVARNLYRLGIIARRRADPAAAGEYLRRSLALRRRLAPGSLAEAECLEELGHLARERDPAAASDLLQQGLAIRERLTPDSLETAALLRHLGEAAADRGRPAEAEAAYRRALAIYARRAPEDPLVPFLENGLGHLAFQREDPAAAADHFQRALAHQLQRAPDSLSVASLRHNLGNVAHHRGDLATAAEQFRQALAIKERLAPESASLASTLHSLGNVARDQEAWEDAAARYRRARDIRQAEVPESLELADTLQALGMILRRQGETAAAAQSFRRALALRERLDPASLATRPVPMLLADETYGLAVEAIESPAGAAVLQTGDLLLTWERGAAPPANPRAARGVLRSPFDLEMVEMEQAPRGPVTLRGLRAGEEFSATLPPHRWKLTTHPRLSPDRRRAYQAAVEQPGTGDRLRQLATSAQASPRPAEAAWLLSRGAGLLAAQGEWEPAHALLDAAEALEPAPTVRALLAKQRGDILTAQQQPGAAEAAYREALRRGEEPEAESLFAAAALHALGNLAYARRDPAAAEQLWRQALTIRERRAPDSLDLAANCNNLGLVAFNRGEVDTAEAFHRRALTLREALDPDGPTVAESRNHLGLVAWYRGDLATAETELRRSLVLRERHRPDSSVVADSLTNLGVVARRRGDLVAAEAYQQRSLAIQQKLAPDSMGVSSNLTNLGNIAHDRGDWEAAETFYLQALALQERHAPDGLKLAATLNNLGIVALNAGDPAAAEAFYQRSLAIKERQAPESLDVAIALTNLGNVAEQRGDLDQAEALHRRALALRRRLAPGGLDEATSLASLGNLAAARGDLAAAEAQLRRALTLQEALAPGTTAVARSCRTLAGLCRRTERREAAAALYRRALDALEAQRGKLGGSDATRSGFAAGYADYYREYIDLLIELGREAEAYHALERSRARGLLALLAERDLVFSTDLPTDLERERRMTAVAYERTQARLGRLSPEQDAEAITQLRQELQALRRRQAEIRERVRAAAPGLAALQDPAPLTLARTREILDPGTLLLAYSVGEERSLLFAVTADRKPGAVHRLPVGRETLSGQVHLFRRLVQLQDPEAAALARDLSATLLGPAARRIGRATRLLILPDGPLHFLPFAALTDPRRRGKKTRWLGEAQPLHTIVSATVYAELGKGRRERGAGSLTAFGDPAYPETAAAALLRGRGPLAPLPATRTEIEGLRALFPDRTTALLGAAASEERAKALGKDVPIIHFACHGIVDERFPLDSALALSLPAPSQTGRENGLLQAWEIFESLRIDADLVTLSACDTGLGAEMGGEGIVGLTRAFQYAGARSLLVSLWPIADAGTATFMQAFYRALKEGATKDVALQQAQAALRSDPHTAAPYYWAPFVLIGDWR